MSSRLHLLLAGLTTTVLLAGCTSQHAPVMASPCPAWVDYPADIHSNDGSPYLGCVNKANLDQMLVDKHDLKKGRALAPANGARQAKAVKDYEEGKTKSSTGTGTTGSALLLQGTNSNSSGTTGP